VHGIHAWRVYLSLKVALFRLTTQEIAMSHKTSWGYIEADGTIKSGSGDFTIDVVGDGQFFINFSKDFADIPAVNVTCNLAMGTGSDGGGNTVNNNAILIDVDAGKARVLTGHGTDRYSRAFTFTAIGLPGD
jgi:hypothetical protein